MNAKRFVLVACIFAALSALCAVSCCSAPAKSPILIGAIFSTTGDNAPLGVPEKETVQMLANQINAAGGIKGRPVKVVFYDDAGKPEQASQACASLLADKNVVAIIGPTLSGPSLAITNMCQNAGMPLVSCAASVKITTPVKSYVFKTAQSDAMAVSKILAYLTNRKVNSVGFIYDSNAFGSSGRDQWKRLSAAAGVKTVAMESFATSDTDMTSQLTKIRSANPKVVVCWGTNPGPAMVAKDMKKLGMTMPLIMSHGIANKDFINLAQSAAEGVVFPAGKLLVASEAGGAQKSVLVKYAQDYQKSYKKPANTFGGHAWDAFMLVVKGIQQAGPDRAKIRAAIENTKGFAGVSGVFNMSSMDHNGLTKDSFAMVKIQGGKWTSIK